MDEFMQKDTADNNTEFFGLCFLLNWKQIIVSQKNFYSISIPIKLLITTDAVTAPNTAGK